MSWRLLCCWYVAWLVAAEGWRVRVIEVMDVKNDNKHRARVCIKPSRAHVTQASKKKVVQTGVVALLLFTSVKIGLDVGFVGAAKYVIPRQHISLNKKISNLKPATKEGNRSAE